jgi:hypothetical protein
MVCVSWNDTVCVWNYRSVASDTDGVVTWHTNLHHKPIHSQFLLTWLCEDWNSSFCNLNAFKHVLWVWYLQSLCSSGDKNEEDFTQVPEMSAKTWLVIQASARDVHENCALLGYYTTSTGVSGQPVSPIKGQKFKYRTKFLEMRQIGCSDMSEINYHSSLCNSPEERSSVGLTIQ